MKRIIVMVLLVFALFLAGCALAPNHSIRFDNNYASDITSLVIGSASIGTVISGGISSYYPINTGDSGFTGNVSGGGTIAGTVSISGNGTHKWTLTMSSVGVFSIDED